MNTGEGSPPSRSRAVLLTACVAFGPLSTDLYLPSLPALCRDLGVDAAAGQLTLSSFLVGFAVGMLVHGPLSDRFGRRPVLLAGIALYVVASILCALAPDIGTLTAARVLQAVGACAGPVVARAMVRDLYPAARAGQIFARMATAMALAPAIGPLIGGQLESVFGWRANFVLLAAIGAVIILGAAWGLPESIRQRDPGATRLRPLLASYGELVAHAGFRRHVMVVATAYAAIFAWISGSPFVLITGAGMPPERFGLAFASMVAGYVVGTMMAGRLVDRVAPPGRLIRVGARWGTVAASGMVGLALTAPAGLLATALPMGVVMIGVGLVLPLAQAGGMAPFPAMAGRASGLLGFAQIAFAALIGIAVGHAVERAGWSMTMAIFLCLAAADWISRRVPDHP